MSFLTGLKEKLTISQCEVDDKEVVVKKGGPQFEAMINPTGYNQTACIQYDNNPAFGLPSEPKHRKATPDIYKINDLILDGTGVVSLLDLKPVKDQIQLLRDVAFTYIGDSHETPVVQVSWGPLLFNARLKKLGVNYTLFKPSGEPLRAKVTLEFVNYKPITEIIAVAANQSPDLTHLVEVKAGDTLPNLCYRIYKDTSFCIAVARVNQLSNFRHLQPGKVLRFPPLV